MKKGLMNNWGLKILSFLLAVMLWLIVVNIDDPVTTQTFNNIPVAVTNAEVLAATNQTYQIEDGTQNVSVTVRAKRSVLNKIKADNNGNETIMTTSEGSWIKNHTMYRV